MLLLSGIFNEVQDAQSEERAARKAEQEYIACLVAALLFAGMLFVIFALTR